MARHRPKAWRISIIDIICIIDLYSLFCSTRKLFPLFVACPSPRMAMPVRHVKKEKLKVKQETTETTKQVKAHGAKNDDVIVIGDDPEVVVIDADNCGSDLPAGADDNPAFVYCGGCETYPESSTCDVCGTMYDCFDPFADEF